MNKFAKIMFLGLVGVLLLAAPAMAQDGATEFLNSNYIGVGLVVFGAAYGISKLAASALDGMARQPEAGGSIQTAMIIAAALIEGFTFYALFICSS